MADIITSPNPNAPALTGSPSGGVGTSAVLERVKDFTAQPAIQRSLPMIGMLGLLGGAALLWSTMAGAPQRDLFAGMGDADKAAVAEALTAANIPYEINRGTGSLTVPETSFYQARMLLAQQGLPKAAPTGDSMISSLPLGASRAVEGEKLRTAREMDLARTIEAIDAVESAKVHVAAESPSVFLRDEAKPQASVMLRLRAGRSLSDSQVQAIVHLVASSVQNLSPDGVSVVDQAGRLLSASGADSASNRQVDIQSKIEARYLEALTKILTPIVGPGNFTAEVHADVDFTETQATRESYPKDTAVVRQEQGSWTGDKNGAGAEARGIPGALSNQPPAASQVTAAPNQTVNAPPPAGTTDAANAAKTSENYNRTYELGREVSVTHNPVGQVKRLSVAVALREGTRKFSRAELASIESLVRGAIGADATRGDVVALSARSFAVEAAAEVKPNWWEAAWVSTLARNLSALLVVALLVFGIGKPLLKRRAAMADEKKAVLEATIASGGRIPSSASPQVRNEIASQLAQAALIDPNKPVTLDMIEATPGYANRAELIRNFVRQDPDRAALVVRDLIRADMPGAA
jgi:flagellar M-ring protein FliF